MSNINPNLGPADTGAHGSSEEENNTPAPQRQEAARDRLEEARRQLQARLPERPARDAQPSRRSSHRSHGEQVARPQSAMDRPRSSLGFSSLLSRMLPGNSGSSAQPSGSHHRRRTSDASEVPPRSTTANPDRQRERERERGRRQSTSQATAAPPKRAQTVSIEEQQAKQRRSTRASVDAPERPKSRADHGSSSRRPTDPRKTKDASGDKSTKLPGKSALKSSKAPRAATIEEEAGPSNAQTSKPRRASFGKADKVIYQEPGVPGYKATHKNKLFEAGAMAKERKRIRNLRREAGVPSTDTSSSGSAQWRRIETLMRTEVNAGRSRPSAAMDRFLQHDNGDAELFAGRSIEQIRAQLDSWSDADYRRNLDHANRTSYGLRNLFATFSTVFDATTRESYLYMHPDDFDEIAATLDGFLNIIHNSQLARSTRGVLTPARMASLLQSESDADLQARLTTWNANYHDMQNIPVDLASYYNAEQIIQILDLPRTQYTEWHNRWFAQDQPTSASGSFGAPIGGYQGSVGEAPATSSANNEAYNSNRQFVTGSDSLELRQLFGPRSTILSMDVVDYYLSFPTETFQAESVRMASNLAAIYQSTLYRRSPSTLTSERRARLVQLPQAEFDETLQILDRNFSYVRDNPSAVDMPLAPLRDWFKDDDDDSADGEGGAAI